ncbi:16S rRNA (guanine966-N2)-methyltransferase [Quadrisphaera granulorum]|uniref:16S rRNA (Guanine966-N2)-methyltransferase n=1 Tax=Quadrisphaera granulorum TaxID=317664 RepID=A0A316AHG7_9ACTN|nr:16S rRNA (guanine(966)-N(2))-methyltransferase RsmD [Quadrisphaera granulorum]PWJ56374.1 16S rRNA (guanine966-N2)-methyltransferase [Quadrisphaera granulorum]SZE95008.1 16S rRNA (guanine966-N2)-methyltransferase [Quadrisphaera granulorum]
MTRIIAGAAGGRRLEVPRGATRPTSDRVREALFSRLEHERDLAGAAVVDLFAGSGALGLEAASRGADRVLLVDSAAAAAAVCRRNAAALGLPGVTVRAATAASVLAAGAAAAGLDGGADVVLIDPPYDLPEDALADLLTDLVAHGWLAPLAHLVVERSTRSPEPAWPAGVEVLGEKRYGETVLWWAEPAEVSKAQP